MGRQGAQNIAIEVMRGRALCVGGVQDRDNRAQSNNLLKLNIRMPVIQQTTLRLKWLARLSGWLFWSLVASWVLVVSLWMSLHLFIVPRIDEFRPWLQQQGAQALGVRLELGAIRATSRGWVPAFEVSDVQIGRAHV